jgi:hypothetical protein
MIGTLPRDVSKSSITNNFGERVEHGPHFYESELQITSTVLAQSKRMTMLWQGINVFYCCPSALRVSA